MTAIDVSQDLIALGEKARAASRMLAKLGTQAKNRALLNIADALLSRQEKVLEANRRDYEAAEHKGPVEAPLDRLLITPERLTAMADDVRNIQRLTDPVGEQFDVRTLPNGLILGKRRVPLGVIGAIYESRPNVTVDIATLCLKAGNAVLLRGGTEAFNSNRAPGQFDKRRHS